MKKLIYILSFTLVLSGLLISCVDLQEDVRSQVSSDNYYKTETDADAASIGLYSSLTHNYSGVDLGLAQASWSYYNRMNIVSWGTLTDDITPGLKGSDAEYRATCYFNHSPVGSKFQHYYRLSYEIINRANAIIDRVPNIKGDQVHLQRIVNEAKFIRALIYFNTVRFWGPIPLVLHETTSLKDLQVPRSDVETVYAQIKSDLNDALALPSTRYDASNSFRANRVAVRALLVAVAVTQRDWNTAVINGDSIFANNSKYKTDYDLFPKYADNFSTTKKNTVEHIFDAYFFADATTGGTGNVNALGASEAAFYGYPAGLQNGVQVYPALNSNGSATHGVNLALRNKFKKGDTRIPVTFSDTIYKDDKRTKKYYYPHFKKFRDITTTTASNSGVNYPIIRLAQVYLYYAEAQNELGNTSEALKYLNKIRDRAGTYHTSLSDQNLLRDSIFHERRLEFAEEIENRYFDLVRLNGSGSYLLYKAIPALLTSGLKGIVNGVDKDGDGGLSYESSVSKNQNLTANPTKYLLLPIPYTELQANPNLTQNPGW
jgi:starch-binding outer membrane protein, SusD/RagB family